MNILPDHFRHLSDPVRAAELFKRTVQTVELEIHSYCNRTCDFCPNSFIDRRSQKILLDPAIYSKIMNDLAGIDYRGIVWYSRYNEPTSDRELFLERLREAHARLPNARLQTYSNGDYLTQDYIAALRDAGLVELHIMTYLAKGEEPTRENFIETTLTRLKKLGLPYEFVEEGLVNVAFPGLKVTYNYHNFLKIGTDRGGTLAAGHHVKRTSPCTMPLYGVYVDYNGAMVPCCDTRSDFDGHSGCVTYKLTPQNSIIDGYANSKLVLWRRSMLRYGEKKSPCATCTRWAMPETPELHALFKNIARTADEVADEEKFAAL